MNQTENKHKRTSSESHSKFNDGLLPPQDIELEEAILGAMMVDPESLLDAMSLLRTNMFYKAEHQVIYETYLYLFDKNSPIDIRTVSTYLKDKGRLDEAGGAQYLVSLTQKVGSGARTAHYAKIVAEKYFLRMMISIGYKVQQAAYSNELDEAIEIYNSCTYELDDIIAGSATDKTLRNLLDQHVKVIENRAKNSENGKLSGIHTGFAELDRETNGWQPGDLVVIAARPGMGKTALALHHAIKAAFMSKIYVSFFSLEMTDIKLVDRIVGSHAQINTQSLKSGRLNNDEWKRLETSYKELAELNISIDDSTGTTLRHIISKSRAKKRKKQLGMIVIDYLGLVETDYEGKIQRDQEVQKISRSLKKLAKELGIPILLLCQLNRDVERRGGIKRPQISDLRESGAIEQDADIVLFPWRPEHLGIDEMENTDGIPVSTKGIGVYIRAKMREGSCGDTWFRYDPGITNIRDISDFDDNKNAF